MRIKPYALPMAQFAFIGPGIGVLVFLMLGAPGAPSFPGATLMLVFGYGIGVVPALLAGLIYVVAWNARPFFKRMGAREFGAWLGAVSGVAAFAAFAMATRGRAVPASLAVYALPLIAGAVCGALAASTRDTLHAGLGEPVNYESLHVRGSVVEYAAAGQRHAIPLQEVSRLELVREEALFPDLDGPYIESKWLLHPATGPAIEIMDESPHRRLLLRTFEEHLPGFDAGAARQGLAARGEGRWLCYQAAGAAWSSALTP